MLLQSHRKTADGKPLFELLPALPTDWTNGSVTGLRARGAVTVDVDWTDGKLKKCRFKADKPCAFEVALPDGRRQAVSLKAGESMEIK